MLAVDLTETSDIRHDSNVAAHEDGGANVAVALIQIVERAHALSRILSEAVRVIAGRLRVDGCSAFLIGDDGVLVRGAADGSATLGACEGADDEAMQIAAEAAADRHAPTARTGVTSVLASPMILRDVMVGVLVLQSVGARDFSAAEVETLATICAQLVGIVENARVIEALDRGERPAPPGQAHPRATQSPVGERVLQGVGASPGIAMGTAMFRGSEWLDRKARDVPAGEPAAERARVATAVEKTRNDLLRVQIAAARAIDEEHALIFGSHLLLLNDPMLLGRIDDEIGAGASAPRAIGAAFDDFESRLREVRDTYLQEKLDDVGDLRGRLLGHVLGDAQHERTDARVVLSSRLAPSMVVEITTEGAAALVTEGGGATSHGVLLARAVGIPAVTGITGMLDEVRPDDRLIVDGTTGVFVVRPTAETTARYEESRRRAEQEKTEYAKYRDVLCRTADGVRVKLDANVGVASDLVVARENGAEGIGLYRTEFPFIVRDTFPTRGEQVRLYRKAYELFPHGSIHFRILDLGGDKFVSSGSVASARNAFHGYRSLRVLFDHPDVFRDQVRALALAAGDRELCILIPMVTSMDELRRSKELIAEALAEPPALTRRGVLRVGAMIEVPAAVELAADIAREVDFLSIGTNDLMQYALVVDREDARMAPLSDPYHPAILRMVARVAVAARGAGKPLGVCGEIAARPDVALAMIALGVDSLSVVPTAIPALKQALAGARLEPMRRAMPAALALSDAREVAAALRVAFEQ
jgi:phosphotransferase system enzyme I (PtsP)